MVDVETRATKPTLFVMVGLPGAGKTMVACDLERKWSALRLTPDDWMIPLFGEPEAGGKRDVLEGRLISVAMRLLRAGMNVILDFGCWSKDERSALRFLATDAGARCQLVYLEVDEQQQHRRLDMRSGTAGATTFEISDHDLADFRRTFEPPEEAELSDGVIELPPRGYESWAAWASERWPTSLA